MYKVEPLPERTVTSTSLWAVAFAVLSGARVVRHERLSGRKSAFTLDDTEGVATRAMDTWRFGSVTCDARELIRHHGSLLDIAKGGR